MRITLFILAVLLAVGARAQTQQNHFTTNKVSSGTGLTNVFTGTNALGARIYQLRMDVAAGPGVTLSTNGSQITFTAAGAGLGDVTGPTGATNMAIPIFDGASGKLLRDGGMTLSDLSAAGHTHAQLHDRGHGVTSASDHTDWPAGLDLTELGYVNGVTSGIQAQIDARQPASANLTNWSALATGSKQDADTDLLQLATITWASGDVLYRTADSLTNLAKGVDGKVLKLVSGFPSWETDATGVGATGDDVWVNHADVTNPNFTNSATITWSVSGTNVSASLASSYQPADAQLDEWAGQGTNSVSLGAVIIGTTNVVAALAGKQAAGSYQAADAQLDEWSAQTTNGVHLTAVTIWTTNVVEALAGKQAAGSYLTEATASVLYQGTNANLTSWSALAPSSKQDADADLTSMSAIGGAVGQLIQHDGTRWTNTAANPFQATNANLTALSAYGPTTWQATNANLTGWAALATSAKQDYDADLTTWAGITSAANVGTFLATPSSANLRGALTDENGTGSLLFDGASSLALGSSSFTAITNSALTAGRVIFSGTTKEQADDADLTFSTDTLTATKVSAPTAVYMGSFMATNYLYTSSPTNLQAIGLLSLHGLTVTNLTASQAVVTDASKNLASVAYTGAGNVMRTRVGVVRNIWIPASAMNPPASGAPSYSTNTWATTTDGQQIECYDFDDTADEEWVQFTLALPESWDGNDPKAKIFWKPVTDEDASEVVVWGMVGGSLTDDETGGNTLGTIATVNDTGLQSTNKMHITSAVTVDIGGSPSAGHFVWFKVARDGNNGSDSLDGDARLIGVMLQYTETTTEPSAW